MTPRDRRALILGAIVVAASLLLTAAPAGVRGARAFRADLAARGETLARMRLNVREGAAVLDSAAAVRDQLAALAPRLLAGRTAAEATADLNSRLAAIAAGSAATLERTDGLGDSTSVVWLRRVTVRAAFESDTRGALGLLRSIARQPELLTVRSVRVVAPDPASPDAAPELLKIEATVSGWYIVKPGREP